MRIISGKYKSKRLVAPKNLPVRPTTDMAKEGLFNILNNYYHFSQIKVLDLFAGTGNISFEFASRGTTVITAVDKHAACIHFVDKTASELEMDIQTLKADVFSYLEKQTQKFDVIFADPPYDIGQEAFEKIYQLVFENDLLTEEGILILEHDQQTELSSLENHYQTKRYGGCYFSFFEEYIEEKED